MLSMLANFVHMGGFASSAAELLGFIQDFAFLAGFSASPFPDTSEEDRCPVRKEGLLLEDRTCLTAVTELFAKLAAFAK